MIVWSYYKLCCYGYLIHVFWWTYTGISVEHKPRNWLLAHMAYILMFSRYCQILFWSACTNLYSLKQHMKVLVDSFIIFYPFFYYSEVHVVVSCCSFNLHVSDDWWNSQSFMCLLTIWKSFMKHLFKYFVHFFSIGLSPYFYWFVVLDIFWKSPLRGICVMNIFSYLEDFYSLNGIFR